MSNKNSGSAWHKFWSKIRTLFLSGLLVVVPIAASIWILAWVFRTVDELLRPLIRNITGYDIFGMGIAVIIILVFLVGILAHNFFGKKLIQLGNALLKRIPIVKQVYGATKQVMDSFSGTGAISRTAFREVVLVEFPANIMHTIAFITNEYTADDGCKYYSIYIPSTPVPWSGFSAIITEDKMTRSNISIDEAIKMVISGMMIAPPQMQICNTDHTANINLTQNLKNNDG